MKIKINYERLPSSDTVNFKISPLQWSTIMADPYSSIFPVSLIDHQYIRVHAGYFGQFSSTPFIQGDGALHDFLADESI